MDKVTTALYVLAVFLALAFVQGVLPETPLGFGIFWLLLAAFAHPFVKWKHWGYPAMGVVTAPLSYYLMKRASPPFELLVGVAILLTVGMIWSFVAKRRERHGAPR